MKWVTIKEGKSWSLTTSGGCIIAKLDYQAKLQKYQLTADFFTGKKYIDEHQCLKAAMLKAQLIIIGEILYAAGEMCELK
jgi:hypothetical protein